MPRVVCPGCKQSVRAAEDQAGQVVSCPDCGKRFRVPAARPAPARRDEGEEAPDGGAREWRPNLDEEEPEGPAADAPGAAPPEVRELGPVWRVHNGSRQLQMWAFVGGAALCLLTFCCISGSIAALFDTSPGPGPAPPGRLPPPRPVGARAVTALLAGLPGVLFLGLGVALFVYGGFFKPQRVFVCRDGLARLTRRGAEVCRWDDARAAWQRVTRVEIYNRWGMHVGTRIDHVYTIERDDGQKLVFKNAASPRHIQDLGNTILRETTRRLLPLAYKAVVEDRRTISFGPFGVAFDALHFRDESIPWADVGRLTLRDGKFTIRDRVQRDDFAVVPIHETPNAHVFLNLVENLSGRKWQ